ncbi:hypothetical protein ACHAWT_001444 [Skeletonema menzelii]
MSSPPSSEDGEAAQAAENPVVVTRTIMVGSSPSSSSSIRRENSSVGLDVSVRSNRSTASTVKASGSQNAASASPQIEDLVPVSVADAGLNAYGCVFVEVWLMNPDGTALSRVEPGGHWMDPSFANSLHSEKLTQVAHELNRFARDCPPGAGLAGTLFNSIDFYATKRKVYWRQIREMLNDPFVQRNVGQRMKRLDQIGIGLVGFVPFSFQEENGLVCFFARSNADLTLLRSPMNEGFLIGSTDLIGSQIAIRKNREQCAALRRELFMQAVKKVKKEFQKKNGRRSFGDLASDESTLILLAKQREEAQSPLEEEDMATRVKKKVVKIGKKVLKRINNSSKKWKGTNLEGPPRQSFGESAFIIFGVFFTMLTVQKLANAIEYADPNFKFNGGWYASSLCIIFALTPAPVGQPRQIFAAHLWNMLVGLALRQIPTGPETQDFMNWDSNSFGLPIIWKQALAVAFGVAGQAKLGILHPPATGLSYAFVNDDKYSWGSILTVWLADLIVVAMSVLILNLSEAKQYPLYWLGFEWGDMGKFGWSHVQSRKKHGLVMNAVSDKETRKMSVDGDDSNV